MRKISLLICIATFLAYEQETTSWAATKKNPKREISFTALEGSDYYLHYPKGWQLGNPDRFHATNAQCGIRMCTLDIYLGFEWFKAVGKRGPWAHIRVTHSNLQDEYLKRDHDCFHAEIKDIGDYLHELNCDFRDQPCANQNQGKMKYPRLPVGGACGHFLKGIKLPRGRGYLFEAAIPDTMSSDKAFNDALRQMILVYDIPGERAARIFELYAPSDQFERYFPYFTGVVDSFRIKTPVSK